jgi:hypothetical protein
MNIVASGKLVKLRPPCRWMWIQVGSLADWPIETNRQRDTMTDFDANAAM